MKSSTLRSNELASFPPRPSMKCLLALERRGASPDEPFSLSDEGSTNVLGA
jgi:hypothetical protein